MPRYAYRPELYNAIALCFLRTQVEHASSKTAIHETKKEVRSDLQGLRKAKGFIDRALWELRAGPVLSKPIRKWLVDLLDEKADSPVRLVIKQKVGQPRGNLGMTFDGVRMEAAEYVAALMHASKTPRNV